MFTLFSMELTNSADFFSKIKDFLYVYEFIRVIRP